MMDETTTTPTPEVETPVTEPAETTKPTETPATDAPASEPAAQ